MSAAIDAVLKRVRKAIQNEVGKANGAVKVKTTRGIRGNPLNKKHSVIACPTKRMQSKQVEHRQKREPQTEKKDPGRRETSKVPREGYQAGVWRTNDKQVKGKKGEQDACTNVDGRTKTSIH
jgi:hypothetical protein